ncbi:MAG TPA: iron chelate uptake ABC transporter family permease subunit [Haloplasmataceae bacterium]
MFDLLLESYTLRVVIIGTMILGAVSGTVGVFSVLRKQALIGDALSHAAFPGVVLAFMLVGVKDLYILLIGAACASAVSLFLMTVIKRYTPIKQDALLALTLSSFFGFGQVLLIYVQNSGNASQAGLKTFIFGQAATMLVRDVYLLLGISIVVFLIVLLFWKELKLYIFNEPYFISLGFNKYFMDWLLNSLLIVVIMSGIRVVGVILMSALLIAPAIGARLLSHRFHTNVILAAIFGMAGAFVGTLISAQVSNLATGPTIAVVLSAISLFLLLISPKRGLLKRSFERFRLRKQVQTVQKIEDALCGKVDKNEKLSLMARGYLIETKGILQLSDRGRRLLRRFDDEEGR